ncbi:hypothetical protein BHM03_00058636 [Ensete ventricosum]|nr:hypothetical protein BHM03_00058636 [Ensete ventricosum]
MTSVGLFEAKLEALEMRMDVKLHALLEEFRLGQSPSPIRSQRGANLDCKNNLSEELAIIRQTVFHEESRVRVRSARACAWEWACVPLRACVSALLCLGLRLRSALGTATSSLTEEWAAEGDCSLGRFLLYDRSAAKEGRRSLLRSAIPGGESAISGVEGRRLFSPRSGTDSRARNGGGCAAIGAGFTAALPAATPRATAASAIGVERARRVVASSPLGGWRSLGRATPWMRATLLRILCSSGMLLRWLLPSGLRWLLPSGTPLSSNNGRGLLLNRWLLHSGRGLLLSNSRWFLPSSLGRFHTRMFHR